VLCSRSRRTVFSLPDLPCNVASCNGTRPSMSAMFKSAPAAINNSTTDSWPQKHARWMAVRPYSSRAFEIGAGV
jgi:hypothetical protein